MELSPRRITRPGIIAAVFRILDQRVIRDPFLKLFPGQEKVFPAVLLSRTRKLIHIGFGNVVNTGKIIAIVSPDSAPVKRMVQKAKETGMAIASSSPGRGSLVVAEIDSE